VARDEFLVWGGTAVKDLVFALSFLESLDDLFDDDFLIFWILELKIGVRGDL
jgi:hypothetical protein